MWARDKNACGAYELTSCTLERKGTQKHTHTHENSVMGSFFSSSNDNE